MTRALLLGASGHLGAALREHCPPDVELITGCHTKRLPRAVQFNLADDWELPEVDVVVGSFPLARSIQAVDIARQAEAISRYRHRCRRARIVQLSSDAVFSGRAGAALSEDAPTDAQTPYGIAQAVVDATLLDQADDTLIIRTSFIFGFAGGHVDKRLAPFLDDTSDPARQSWPGNVFRSPTEVNFLAVGIWRAIASNLTGILNLAGPSRSIHGFFKEALSPLIRVRFPEAVEETRPEIARDTSLSGARMERELGLRQEENWGWYQRHRPQPHG